MELQLRTRSSPVRLFLGTEVNLNAIKFDDGNEPEHQMFFSLN